MLIAIPCFALAMYVYWKGLKRLVSRGLPGIRYWLPTAMVAAGCLTLLPTGCSDNTLRDIAATIGMFVNWPASLGAGLGALVLSGAGISGWPLGIGTAAAAWASWHALIRIVEGRMEDPGPLMLKLT